MINSHCILMWVLIWYTCLVQLAKRRKKDADMVKKFNCYLVKKETKEDVIQALLHVPDMATGESEKQPLIWSFQALQSPVFTEHILENNLSHEQ